MPDPQSSMVPMSVSVGTARVVAVPNNAALSSATESWAELFIRGPLAYLIRRRLASPLDRRIHQCAELLGVDHCHAFRIVVEVCKYVTSRMPWLGEPRCPGLQVFHAVTSEVAAAGAVKPHVHVW